MLADIDLVVDGFYQTAQVGAGVELAEVIKARFSGGGDADLWPLSNSGIGVA
jgi:hypothetical protein